MAVGMTRHGGGVLLLESPCPRAQHRAGHSTTTSTAPRLSLLPAGGRLAPEQSPAQGYVATVLPCREQWPRDPRVHTPTTSHPFPGTGVTQRGALFLLFGASCPRRVAPGARAILFPSPQDVPRLYVMAVCPRQWSVCLSIPSRSLARE